nr:transmembrane protein 190 [Chrysemys picta bellii]
MHLVCYYRVSPGCQELRRPVCYCATGIGSFFRPLTCTQHPSLRTPCGGNAENFYPSQCLQRKCCHANGTCFHRAIDAPRQRRNAGILGGLCVGAAGLFLCVCVACRLKGTRAAGKETGKPKSTSDAEVADYLTKLLEESDQEEEPKEGGE